MKKVSIIYWSKGGNVEFLANTIADELYENNIEINLKQVGTAELNDILDADAIAFGSPAMDNNRIEQNEMEPFIKQLEKLSIQKNIILFGTYGWGQSEFIDEWEKRMRSYGFNVTGKLAIGEAPSDGQIKELKDLSKNLINLE